MGYPIKQGQTAQPLLFLMIDSADHVSGKPGLSPTVTLSKAGGTFATPAGAVTEVGNGWYQVAGNATDSATLGPLLLHASATGADPTDDRFDVVAYDPLATSLGLILAKTTNITGFTDAPAVATDGSLAVTLKTGTHTGAIIPTVSTLTGHTPQTGDAFARIGPDGAGLTDLGDARLANLDATVSSRLATSGYTAPPTPPTVAAIRAEMDANSTKLANLDVAVSTRSTYAGGDTTGTTTLLSRVSDSVALAGTAPGWYTAPPTPPTVAAIRAELDANSTKLAYLTGPVALAATALSTAVWTNAKAAYLDASITSVATGGVSPSDIADAVVDALGTVDANLISIAGQAANAAAPVTFPASIGTSTFGGLGGTAPAGWINTAAFAAGTTIPRVTLADTTTNLTNAPTFSLGATAPDGWIRTATFASGTTVPRVTLVDTTTTTTNLTNGGGGSADWTTTERQQIRHRLGIDGSAAQPAGGSVPSLATAAALGGLGTSVGGLITTIGDRGAGLVNIPIPTQTIVVSGDSPSGPPVTFPVWTVADDSGAIVTGATVSVASVTDPSGNPIADHGVTLSFSGPNVSATYDVAAKGEAWLTLAVSKQGSTFTGFNAAPRAYLASDSGSVAVIKAVSDMLAAQQVAGSVTATSTTTAVKGNSGLSAADGFYEGMVLVFTSGPLRGIPRRIESYTGSTRTFGFATGDPLPAVPSVGATFAVQGLIVDEAE